MEFDIERAKVATDLLKSFAWPAAIVWIAWFFRVEFRAAFARLIEAGPTGVKLALPQQVASRPTGDLQSSTPTKETLDDSIAEIRRAVLPEQLESFADHVRETIHQKLGSKSDATEKFLLYAGAASALQLSHERTYRVIFGSQIAALTEMNKAGGAIEPEVRARYDSAAERFPEFYASVPFEKWFEFLLNSGLCTLDGAGRFQLTLQGRGFLRYLLDNRLSLDKAF